MAIYVVRHARAGDRADWEGDDRLRPLTRSGRRQAEALAAWLKKEPIDAILSSPYVRCMQTLEPLAEQGKLPIEPRKDLEEGSGGESLVRIVAKFKGRGIVLCTHGDLVEEFLEQLIEKGLVPRTRANTEKGSTWVIEETAGKITGARYVAAP
ncbi:MAG: 8-oxo-dGTP diphosphatase [Chloroflexota bacterium]|jgi:8-oxo-dGTP diphosphatase|nr:8-oxo-dGTP diphosphatase [Chloroflexota bacterium]